MTATAQKETPKAPNPTPAIALDTSNDYAIVARELSAGADDLKKIADKVTEAGYPREGMRIRQDADQIVRRIVPKFQPQTTLSFKPEGLSVDEQIERSLLEDVRNSMKSALSAAQSHAKAKTNPGEFDMESHVTRLCKKLALRVSAFGHECAERGVNAGISVGII